MPQSDQRGQHVARDQYNVSGDMNIVSPNLNLVLAEQRNRKVLKTEREFLSFRIERRSLEDHYHELDHIKQNTLDVSLTVSDVKGKVKPPSDLLQLPPKTITPTLSSNKDDSPITRVFREYANKDLVILGDPGTGKTVLLLELMRDLIQCAKDDQDCPIPILVDFSSWVNTLSFQDWLLKAIHKEYGLPPAMIKPWIDRRQILPLLDGLDEVPLADLSKCIRMINDHHKSGSLRIVLACRKGEELLPHVNKLSGFKIVEPLSLTDEQVATYLEKNNLVVIQNAIRNDSSLKELITLPIWLHMVTQTYQRLPIDDLLATPTNERRDKVLATYVDYQLTAYEEKEKNKNSHKFQETKKYLSWLAEQMQKHGQTRYYIERMQPDWLPDKYLTRYRSLTSYFVYLLISLPIFFLVFELWQPDSTDIFKLIIFCVLGVASTCLGGTLLARRFMKKDGDKIQPAEAITFSWKKLAMFFFVNVPSTSWRGADPEMARKRLGRLFGLIQYLPGFTLLGLALGGLVLMLLQRQVNWSYLLPSAVFLVINLQLKLRDYGVEHIFETKMLQEKHLNKPNQGIRSSLKIALGITFFVGGSYAVVSGLGFWFLSHLDWKLGVVIGLAAGLGYGLFHGGGACIKHFVLRYLLWKAKCTPLNYVRFLDYAAKSNLLRKSGGGYTFIHQLLLGHFAKLGITPLISKTVEESGTVEIYRDILPQQRIDTRRQTYQQKGSRASKKQRKHTRQHR